MSSWSNAETLKAEKINTITKKTQIDKTAQNDTTAGRALAISGSRLQGGSTQERTCKRGHNCTRHIQNAPFTSGKTRHVQKHKDVQAEMPTDAKMPYILLNYDFLNRHVKRRMKVNTK
ncbi:hypothetical protein Tcan_11829 [Toxocara canis]|uniref:Uncharacterized protein n=1 Tax=Toxocara canis TaxID=6265 RepID=A0A0B2W4E1_TOXCA|nr:hypothetical protein Tcan_11829 [Toxocara canis]